MRHPLCVSGTSCGPRVWNGICFSLGRFRLLGRSSTLASCLQRVQRKLGTHSIGQGGSRWCIRMPKSLSSQTVGFPSPFSVFFFALSAFLFGRVKLCISSLCGASSRPKPRSCKSTTQSASTEKRGDAEGLIELPTMDPSPDSSP